MGESSPGKVVPASELVDAKITADAAGQWAASARAGSEYGKTQYSAGRATGAPNVTVVGNSPDAWCPAVRNVGMDWLEVTFANPVSAVEVRVQQSEASGAIAKVEAFEPDGTAHVWWEGTDPYQAPAVRKIVVRRARAAHRVSRGAGEVHAEPGVRTGLQADRRGAAPGGRSGSIIRRRAGGESGF
jgi:hypothetical protein